MDQINAVELAKYIDHTCITALATSEDIRKLCREAVEYGFHCVCVNPRWVSLAADELDKTGVAVCSVAGFPLGADTTAIKVAQAKDVIMAGADEVDMVADLAAVLEGDIKFLDRQFHAMVKACSNMRPKVLLKVIIESAALNHDQIQLVCESANRCGVDFVKTSTGLNPAGGATIEAVQLMKLSAPKCKVKAAGGIRTLEQALAMIQAGAERIGTSAGIAILNELKAGQ